MGLGQGKPFFIVFSSFLKDFSWVFLLFLSHFTSFQNGIVDGFPAFSTTVEGRSCCMPWLLSLTLFSFFTYNQYEIWMKRYAIVMLKVVKSQIVISSYLQKKKSRNKLFNPKGKSWWTAIPCIFCYDGMVRKLKYQLRFSYLFWFHSTVYATGKKSCMNDWVWM